LFFCHYTLLDLLMHSTVRLRSIVSNILILTPTAQVIWAVVSIW